MENNLDIYIEELLFSSSNITFDGNNYFSIIESSLKRNSKFYDLLMIDIIHTKRLGKYTADLSKYVSKELIDSYTSKSFSKIIYSNNKLVGLVNTITFSCFYFTFFFYFIFLFYYIIVVASYCSYYY